MKSTAPPLRARALAGAQAVDRAVEVAERDARFGVGAQRAQRLAEALLDLAERGPGERVVRLGRDPGLQLLGALPAAARCRARAPARRGERGLRAQQQHRARAVGCGTARAPRVGARRVAARQQRLRRCSSAPHARRARRRAGCRAPGRARDGDRARRRGPSRAAASRPARSSTRASSFVGRRSWRRGRRRAPASGAARRRACPSAPARAPASRVLEHAEPARRRPAPVPSARSAPRRCARWSAGGCAGRGSRRCRSGARRLVELLEHRRHAARREAGAGHHAKPTRSASRSMSREKFSWPCIASRLAADDRGVGGVGAAAARLAASSRAIIAARLSSDWRLAVADAARDVALRDVRQLVRQHRGQLVARGGHARSGRGARRRSRRAARRR